jgi:segregation and condensation protein B
MKMSNPEIEDTFTEGLSVVQSADVTHKTDLSDPAALARSIEAILMVVDEPVTELTLASVLEVTVDRVTEALEALLPTYEERGFSLKAINGGWRFYSHPDSSAVVEKFVLDGQQNRLTQAALETLAVIAYRQPVSRARVSAIRGVNVEAVMKTLITRGLVEEYGVENETGAILYKTTSYFLERLGLNALTDLPPLAPHLPDIDGLDEILDSLTD